MYAVSAVVTTLMLLSMQAGKNRFIPSSRTLICLCAYVPMCLCAFVPLCVCAYVPMCLCAYVHMCAYHMFMCVRVYEHVYVYVYGVSCMCMHR